MRGVRAAPGSTIASPSVRLMANPSQIQPAPRGALPCWTVLIDARGIIRSCDGCWPLVNEGPSIGAHYYDSLLGVCGSLDLAAAAGACIRSVATGQAQSFRLDFDRKLPGGATRISLSATAHRLDREEGVLIVHRPADGAADPQSDKLQLLGRLTGGVVHDFANLVTLVGGYSEILLKRMDAADPNRAELEEICKAAGRGACMTAQLLDFLRKEDIPTRTTDLNALIAEVSSLLRPLVGEHIHLATDLEPSLELVRADESQVARVIMNLAVNARDAMPHGGHIVIRTANAPAHCVSLEVADDGCGMDRATLGNLFQPFFTTKKQTGTGLGLDTVHQIVTEAGGRIDVHSEPGHGATFTIYLPATDLGKRTSVAALPRHTTGEGTILLAEDDECVRKLLKHLLADTGYRVLDAADGMDALRTFEANRGSVDLLLTDIVMPGLHGVELARRAMALQAGLRVIYMSGYTDDVLVSAGPLDSAICFLRKPLHLETLLSSIRHAMDAVAAR